MIDHYDFIQICNPMRDFSENGRSKKGELRGTGRRLFKGEFKEVSEEEIYGILEVKKACGDYLGNDYQRQREFMRGAVVTFMRRELGNALPVSPETNLYRISPINDQNLPKLKARFYEHVRRMKEDRRF